MSQKALKENCLSFRLVTNEVRNSLIELFEKRSKATNGTKFAVDKKSRFLTECQSIFGPLHTTSTVSNFTRKDDRASLAHFTVLRFNNKKLLFCFGSKNCRTCKKRRCKNQSKFENEPERICDFDLKNVFHTVVKIRFLFIKSILTKHYFLTFLNFGAKIGEYFGIFHCKNS